MVCTCMTYKLPFAGN